MNRRNKEINRRFVKSWYETESFYIALSENHNGFGFVNPILSLLREMKESGESNNFRFGTSMHSLIISRSVDHGIRQDQKEIRIECIGKLIDGFEYELMFRQGTIKYREYRVTNLNDKKNLRLIQTLKETIVD